jgi:hypothetical protein
MLGTECDDSGFFINITKVSTQLPTRQPCALVDLHYLSHLALVDHRRQAIGNCGSVT